MCGIFCLITDEFKDFKSILQNAKDLLNHRGPDSFGHTLIKIPENNMHILLAHTRLHINGNNTTQPIKNELGSIYLIINGEIFNWHELENELNFTCTQSDCEIILPLYEKYKDTPEIIFQKLSGQYSFVLVDLETRNILVGRDHIGITPLYSSINRSHNQNTLIFSSELKVLTKDDNKDNIISTFLPRSYYNSSFDNCFISYPQLKSYMSLNDYSSYNCKYIHHDNINVIHDNIRSLLTNSVKTRLIDMLNNKNGDFGVLLSGGLDSSLIASLIVKIAKESGVLSKRIKTFSIGINKNSPDLIAAREVAQFLQTDHYEYYYSVQEGIDNIKNVIWYIESYDCTSVRASTAMYMLTKQIKKNFPNIKVLYSGELSDELLCYLYGANAPNDDAFQDETVHLVSNVHYFDCLRANKTCMAHGLEVRVPFTDKEYVKYILSLHPKYKRFGPINGYIEKKIVRDSFVGYIPDTILQRKKEQFSDGVSDFNKENNWIDNLKKYTDSMYTDDMFNELKICFPYNTPVTKEHLFYREIFCTLFNSYNNNTSELTVKSWLPKWSENIDPSGRIQSFYN
jgi:asparagine synthase (glutamine-hydrolysing)